MTGLGRFFFERVACIEYIILNRMTYEGRKGDGEILEGETGEHKRDEEERQEPILKK